ETIDVDVRIISATNKDLKQEIKNGNFREDLYYRLNVVNLQVPPLRDRKDDIPLLMTTFLKEFTEENKKKIEGIDPKARLILSQYSWPGNVRELRNCIESAVVLCKGTIINIDDLPPYLRASSEKDYIKLNTGISLADAEKQIITLTLNRYGGNKSKTAEILGIGRKTLHRKLNEYNIVT
ncbi:MAG: helix-turn-helix domain-containing protein, partial [Spirochaetia bacterium]